MIDLVTQIAQRTRQHHAIEHATIHLLSDRLPGRRVLGLSDPMGFTLFGRFEQPQVQRAVADAMLRLQAGEGHLAIHPNCGTNLATAGVLVALAATIARLGRRNPVVQFGRTTLLVLPALVASQPLGMRLQKFTTMADVTDRWMAGVRTTRLGPLTVHRVVLE